MSCRNLFFLNLLWITVAIQGCAATDFVQTTGQDATEFASGKGGSSGYETNDGSLQGPICGSNEDIHTDSPEVLNMLQLLGDACATLDTTMQMQASLPETPGIQGVIASLLAQINGLSAQIEQFRVLNLSASEQPVSN